MTLSPRERRGVVIGAAFVALVIAHALLPRAPHAWHVVHVAFGALYLVPIVAASLWIGPRGGIVTAAASGGAHLWHAWRGWAGDPGENANQVAFAVVFVFVGFVTALLVRAAEEERRRGALLERNAQRDAVVRAIASLTSALRRRDDETEAHCARVAELAVEIAFALRLPTERVQLLRLAALVHDVGKIGVRDDVLLKPDELTPEERAAIERHPGFAAEMLAPILGAEPIAEIVLSHHECPDGTGYPRGLAGEQIALEANVLRVADVYDALVSSRAYKTAVAPTAAIARMQEMWGKLDPLALAALATVVHGHA